ncbi:MAG: SPOR domain-containing protein [Lysobacterales bacterium]
MIARILFLLLLVLNVAAGAWWSLRPAPPPEAFSAADPGVSALVLLHERDANAMSAAAAAASVAAAPADPSAPPRVCQSLGPFETETDMRRALELLTPQTARIQFQESSVDMPRGYWVYLPAYNDRDAALKSARQLNAAGVRDYYVVTAGDHENTVSLGLFRERANAQRRQAQIAALGFPARLEERTEVQRRYWVDYEISGSAPDLGGLPGSRELTVKPIPCG